MMKYFKFRRLLGALFGALFFTNTTSFAMDNLRGERGQFQEKLVGTLEIANNLVTHRSLIKFVKCKNLSLCVGGQLKYEEGGDVAATDDYEIICLCARWIYETMGSKLNYDTKRIIDVLNKHFSKNKTITYYFTNENEGYDLVMFNS